MLNLLKANLITLLKVKMSFKMGDTILMKIILYASVAFVLAYFRIGGKTMPH